jgi:hypothetical protein
MTGGQVADVENVVAVMPMPTSGARSKVHRITAAVN